MSPAPSLSASLACLSPRELQILILIGEGKKNYQIAQALLISKNTLDTHSCHLRTKLDVHSHAELQAIAERVFADKDSREWRALFRPRLGMGGKAAVS